MGLVAKKTQRSKNMTPTEKLERIKAKCEQLLASEQAIAAGCFYEEGFANLAIHLKEDFVSILDNGKTKKLVSSCLEKLGVFVEPDRVFFQHPAA